MREIFFGDGRLRAGWRVLLFVLLFLALYAGVSFVLRLAADFGAADWLYRDAIASLLAATAAGSLLLRLLDRRPPGALGWAWTSGTRRELGAGLLISGAALAIPVAALVAVGAIVFRADPGNTTGFAAALASSFLVLLLAAAAEEAAFRGYPFQVLVQGLGPLGATLSASALFAVAHAFNPNIGVLALVNIFLAGIVLSVAYLRTRSLWLPTAMHLSWNWTMASLFDLPVSGLELFDTPLYDGVGVGPAWMTGGAFGPEGGAAGTAGALLELLLVWKLPGIAEAPEMRALGPLPDLAGAPAPGDDSTLYEEP